METPQSLNDFFQRGLLKLECEDELKAYIVSIFYKFKSSAGDLSKDSITIEYSRAKFKNDFSGFQNIGDWLFFTNVLFPESLSYASRDYYYSVGQMSYYSCYRMVKSWKLFEELAERFVDLTDKSRYLIRL